MKDWRRHVNVETFAAWAFALAAVRGVWLAFDSSTYSALFALISKATELMALALGMGVIILTPKWQIEKKGIALCLLPLTYFIMCMLHTYGGWPVGNGVFSLLLCMIYMLQPSVLKGKVFHYFYIAIQVLNILSIMIWMLYQLGVDALFETVPYYLGGWATYKKLFIFAIYHPSESVVRISDRLCGVFNEPGALGTICALVFIASFKYTKWWEKGLLLITGMLTYSAAFFILVFGFVLVYFVQKDIRSLPIAVLIALFFLQIPYIDWGVDALNEVAARLEITGEGFAGDNRVSAEFQARYDEMKLTSKIYWGYGKNYSFAEATSSYIKLIVQFGYLGFGILSIGWLLCAIGLAKNSEHWIYFTFFCVSLYQRPTPMIALVGYVLVISGFEWISMMNERNVKCVLGYSFERNK